MLPRCNAHFIGSQFYYLVLLLAISSLPLAGTKPQLAQILGPFGTEPVPLGTGLQIPPGNSLPLPSLLTSERLVLGPCPSPALGPVFHSNCRLCHISSGFREHAAIDRPSGRSPSLLRSKSKAHKGSSDAARSKASAGLVACNSILLGGTRFSPMQMELADSTFQRVPTWVDRPFYRNTRLS